MADTWTIGAAWVQAVGSIAAIGAAIWISQQQTRRVLAERRQERIDHISLVQGVANLAYDHIKKTADLIRTDDIALGHGYFDRATGENLSALLLRFDPQKLRSPSGAIGLIALANACAKAAGYAEMAGNLIHENGSAWVVLEDDVDDWEGRALEARNAIMDMTSEL